MEKLYQITTTIVLLLFYLELVQISQISANKFPNGDKLRLLKNGGSVNMCGGLLVSSLQLICNNKFNTMYKRSEDSDTELDILTALYDDDTSTFPFRNRHIAKALIPGSLRRGKRGVVDECCRKSCTVLEMKSYCRD